MGCCSGYLSTSRQRNKTKDEYDPSVTIPRKSCVRLQFLPNNPRDKVAKDFTGRLKIIKKVQRKHIQHENPDIEHGNVNAKNLRKVIVNACNKDKMLLISCDDKCKVKLGIPGNPLDLVPNIKVGWIDKPVEVKATDHDTCFKINVVPSAMFVTDVLND